MFNRGIKSALTRKLLVMSMALVLIVTTAVSFAYWRTGVNSAERDKTLTLQIGQGAEIETSISLADISKTSGKLIPLTVDKQAGDAHEIEFEINVYWVLDASPQQGDNASGVLEVSKIGVFVNYTQGSPTQEQRESDSALFQVTISYNSEINGDALGPEGSIKDDHDSVLVTIKVRMPNEPADRAQYDRVAGKDVNINLRFSITSEYDLAH